MGTVVTYAPDDGEGTTLKGFQFGGANQPSLRRNGGLYFVEPYERLG